MTAENVSNSRKGSGFTLPFDAPEARRQLHLAFGLVTVLAIGVVTAGVAVGGHPLAVKHEAIANRAPVIVMQAAMRVTGAKPI